MSTRISIDRYVFAALVRGQIVCVGNVELALQDIGFDIMREEIRAAQHNPHAEFQLTEDR